LTGSLPIQHMRCSEAWKPMAGLPFNGCRLRFANQNADEATVL
jgi:hypothetical protein